MFNVENLTIKGGSIPADGAEVRFNLKIPGRWVKIANIKIVQLTAGDMNIDFDIWETSDYNPATRADLYKRKLRRNIVQTAAQGGEYGEAILPAIPYKDRDTPGEERTYQLHCRLKNNTGGTASDFAVVITLADIGEIA